MSVLHVPCPFPRVCDVGDLDRCCSDDKAVRAGFVLFVFASGVSAISSRGKSQRPGVREYSRHMSQVGSLLRRSVHAVCVMVASLLARLLAVCWLACSLGSAGRRDRSCCTACGLLIPMGEPKCIVAGVCGYRATVQCSSEWSALRPISDSRRLPS